MSYDPRSLINSAIKAGSLTLTLPSWRDAHLLRRRIDYWRRKLEDPVLQMQAYSFVISVAPKSGSSANGSDGEYVLQISRRERKE